MKNLVDKRKWVLQLHNVTVCEKGFKRIEPLNCGAQENTLYNKKFLMNLSTEMVTGRVIVVMGTDSTCVNALLNVLNGDPTLEIVEGHMFVVTDARPTRRCEECVPYQGIDKNMNTNANPYTSLVRFIEESTQTNKWIKPVNDCSFNSQQCNTHITNESVQDFHKEIHTEGSIEIPLGKTLPLYVYEFTKDLKVLTDVCHFPLLSYLTVEETFYWKLKIAHSNLSKITCNRLVNTLIRRLGLEKIRHCRVGSHDHRQLSTGEKSRVILGLQVLDCHKKFIILKYPTDALDLLYSEMVFHLFHDFAHEQNKCVILSMSKPSIPILYHVDDIIFFHNSHVVYAGPLNKLEAFIQKTYALEDVCGHPVQRLFNLVTISQICCEQISLPRESFRNPECLIVYNKTFQRSLHINALTNASWIKQMFPSCLYVDFKKYFILLIQTCLFFNKKKKKITTTTTSHLSFLQKKHKIFFFQRIYFLLLRSWTNSVHNPYKLITFLLAIFQGLFLGFLFAGARHKTHIDSFRLQKLQNPFEYFEKASFLLSKQDVQILQNYNTKLIEFLIPTQKHKDRPMLTQAVFKNKTIVDFVFNFITCCYKNSDIPKVFLNASDSIDDVYPKPFVSLIQACRLSYTSYVQILEPILMSDKYSLIKGIDAGKIVGLPMQKLSEQCYYNMSTKATLPLIKFFSQNPPTLWKSLSFCQQTCNSFVTNNSMCADDYKNVTQGKLRSLPSSYLKLQDYFLQVMQDIIGFNDTIKAISGSFFINEHLVQSIYHHTQHIIHQCTTILFYFYQIAKAYKASVIHVFLQHCFTFFQNLYLVKIFLFHCIISFHTSITLSGALFSSFTFLTYQSLMSLFSFYEDHELLDVEAARKDYHYSTYCLVQLLLDVPFQILTTTVFSVIMIGVSGFFATSPDYSYFINHILLCNLISQVFFEFAFLVSCLVKDIQLSIIVILYIHILWFLFSGIVIQQNVTSFIPNLIYFTSPFRYSYLAILENFYTRNTTHFGSLPIKFIQWVNGVTFHSTLHQNVRILFGFILIFRLLSILCASSTSFFKRKNF